MNDILELLFGGGVRGVFVEFVLKKEIVLKKKLLKFVRSMIVIGIGIE